LQEQLPPDGNQRSAGFMLDRYLDNLTSYAETVCDTYLDGSDGSRPISRAGSSGEDGPINENESAPRAISPTVLKPVLESHDERKGAKLAVALAELFELRAKAARDQMKKNEARLVAQRERGEPPRINWAIPLRKRKHLQRSGDKIRNSLEEKQQSCEVQLKDMHDQREISLNRWSFARYQEGSDTALLQHLKQ
jgi:hypothetical protein